AVTRNTRVILGVTCVEVHDTVTTDGELTEDTFDWFAQDRDGNVWYFGENTHELEDGLITTIDGTFMAGVNGDKPGIVMKAHPAIGDFYRQEFSLANAEDFAETLSLTESVTGDNEGNLLRLDIVNATQRLGETVSSQRYAGGRSRSPDSTRGHLCGSGCGRDGGAEVRGRVCRSKRSGQARCSRYQRPETSGGKTFLLPNS